MHHPSCRRDASILRIPRLGAPVQGLPDRPQDWLHFCSSPKILGELAAILAPWNDLDPTGELCILFFTFLV